MCEELVVVLARAGGAGGLGVSLGAGAAPGEPHVICRVEDDSPAARSGQVEAGDVILKVNGTDVNRFSTKEVLRCLRLSSDPVTLKLKRDPQIKANFRRFLSAPHDRIVTSGRRSRDRDRSCSSPPSTSSSSSPPSSSNGLCSARSGSGSSSEALLPRDADDDRPHTTSLHRHTPKFEAYMMTGDLMLNLSRVEHHNHHAPPHRTHYHRYNSTPASPVENRTGGSGGGAGCVVQEPVHRYNSSPADPGRDHSHNHTNVNTNAKQYNSQPVSPCGTSGLAAEAGAESSARTQHAVRTSRSEDHLQGESALLSVGCELEEDVTSSLNTLLDTRPDSTTPSTPSTPSSDTHTNGDRSSSPASPTSVSSSVMSSRATPTPHHPPHLHHQQHDHHHLAHPHHEHHYPTHQHRNLNGDMSLSEAISNMSSPDYQEQDQDDMLEAGRECPRMELSDPSDSDSTILVSEPCHKRAKSNPTPTTTASDRTLNGNHSHHSHDYRIVIQVKAEERSTSDGATAGAGTVGSMGRGRDGPEVHPYQELCTGEPGSGDEGSDVESLHSFHYSPKAVDIPSAVRLAKRLYHLDGFKKSDVSRHLSKNNEFSRAVAEEYVKHFDLSGMTLDSALRTFLARFALSGETQERERVLVHFSRRYLECNPRAFNSQDAVHTLTCAIMLLNTDLHGLAGGAGNGAFRRMSAAEFVDNLAELNDGENFPRDTLKQLYHAIRTDPLQWALDTEASGGGASECAGGGGGVVLGGGGNPFLDVPDQSRAVEYKKGYVMRKCCYDANAKKTPFGKRGWKMLYCTLRDLVLFLHKDEHGFRRSQLGDNLHNAIRIHHALATKATDYTKKQHVFRLHTADQAEYLFQTSDSKELHSWVETINFVCAAYSAQPLPGAVGSQRKFQRPLLPCSHTKLNMREQLAAHEEHAARLEEELAALRLARDTHHDTHHARDKEHYLLYEVKRYRTYAGAMRARANTGAGAEEAAPALPERTPLPPPLPHAAPPPP